MASKEEEDEGSDGMLWGMLGALMRADRGCAVGSGRGVALHVVQDSGAEVVSLPVTCAWTWGDHDIC